MQLYAFRLDGRAATGRLVLFWFMRGSPAMTSADLDRQVSGLTVWATDQDLRVRRVVVEVGSGVSGTRPRLRPDLSDPDAKVMVVEHRDWLARFGVQHLAAALSAQGRGIVVADPGETADDLVRDVIEVLTSLCARWCGRYGAWSRALAATNHASGEAP